MKKLTVFLLVNFCLVIFFQYSKGFENKSKIFSPIDKIKERSAKILLSNLIISCNSKNFFLKLKKHKSYPKFGSVRDWKNICLKLNQKVHLKGNKDFIQKNFFFRKTKSGNKGILTGYYEPEIKISKYKKDAFTIPILKKNKNLLKERKEILKNYSHNDVLFWTDNKIDLFFLQIQGSGIGVINEKEKVKLIYDGNNGFKYTSIGKVLIKKKYIEKDKISLFTIKEWLKKNPILIDEIFNLNKRYIFFKTKKYFNQFPIGAMGLNLVPNLSLAIDKSLIPFGLPIYLETSDKNFNKFVISHDTGSAIKGQNRGDLFTGKGRKAELVAGNLKKNLQLIFLVPYNRSNE